MNWTSVPVCSFSSNDEKLMPVIRATIRILFFSLTTILLYAIYISGLSVLYIVKRTPEEWKNRMVRIWARTTATIIGMDLNIKGTPPEAPFFLVSNHLGYLDIIPFFICLDCVFVAKSEVRSWPIIGRMTESVGVIFIDREVKRDIHRVNRLITSHVNDREGIVLFPEGTSTRGDEVKAFKSSLLRYPAEKKLPVSFASITYRTNDPEKPTSEWICWWGDMTFLDHFFNMLKLKSFETIITFGNHKVADTDRKKLADRLHQLVKRQFIPIETD